jgi:hypothetical protein
MQWASWSRTSLLIHAGGAGDRNGAYSTRAILHGRGGDVWEMVKENFL